MATDRQPVKLSVQVFTQLTVNVDVIWLQVSVIIGGRALVSGSDLHSDAWSGSTTA